VERNELNVLLAAVLTTLADVDSAPETTLYLGLGCDMEKWSMIKMVILGGGLATCEGNLVKLTAKGAEMAGVINAIMKEAKHA
jgi:hypothetical protein